MPGRPKYQPTESDRNTVKAMAINGIPHEVICTCLGTKGIDKKTMYVHFRDDLKKALVLANAAVASRLFQMAVTGNPPAATFFWMKCKAGWREVERFEHTGIEGGPIEVNTTAREELLSRISSIAGRKRAEGSNSSTE